MFLDREITGLFWVRDRAWSCLCKLSTLGRDPTHERFHWQSVILSVHTFSARFQLRGIIPSVHAFSAIPRSRSCTLSALYRDPVRARFQRYTAIPSVHAFSAIPRSRPCTPSALYRDPVRARLQRYTAIPSVHAFSAIPRSRPCTPSALYRDPVRARLQRYTAIPSVHTFSDRAWSKLQALVYDILPLEEGAGKRCLECERDPVCTRFQHISRSYMLLAQGHDPVRAHFQHGDMIPFVHAFSTRAWSRPCTLSALEQDHPHALQMSDFYSTRSALTVKTSQVANKQTSKQTKKTKNKTLLKCLEEFIWFFCL